MVHAYRWLYRESPDAPDSLWKWHQPWIDHLLWHAHTFERQVVQRYFATWQALEQANTQLWETSYAPSARYEPWPTWHAWLVEYRELLVLTREVYEGHHGQQRGTPCRLSISAPLACTRMSPTRPWTPRGVPSSASRRLR